MNTDLIIEPLSDQNFPAFLSLITNLAEYEHLTPPDTAAAARLKRDGLGPTPRYQAVLARLGEEPVGYLIWFQTYSSFLARPSLYLEDIFVLEEFRRQGVGKKLFAVGVEEARKAGCARMEWTALDWNTNAHRFYEKLGGKKIGWYFFRLDEEGMREFKV
jgi:GNAT superfamily N-acetyltransferase